jgi:hypothetical protein
LRLRGARIGLARTLHLHSGLLYQLSQLKVRWHRQAICCQCCLYQSCGVAYHSRFASLALARSLATCEDFWPKPGTLFAESLGQVRSSCHRVLLGWARALRWLFATAVAVAKFIPSPRLRRRDFVYLRGFLPVLWRKQARQSGQRIAPSTRWPRPAARTEFMQTEPATKRSAGIVSRPWILDKIRLQSSTFA